RSPAVDEKSHLLRAGCQGAGIALSLGVAIGTAAREYRKNGRGHHDVLSVGARTEADPDGDVHGARDPFTRRGGSCPSALLSAGRSPGTASHTERGQESG